METAPEKNGEGGEVEGGAFFVLSFIHCRFCRRVVCVGAVLGAMGFTAAVVCAVLRFRSSVPLVFNQLKTHDNLHTPVIVYDNKSPR